MEDPLYDYKEDLKTLEELWLEKLQPYDEKGYNQRKKDNGITWNVYQTVTLVWSTIAYYYEEFTY